MQFAGILRLMVDAGLAAVIAKACGRDLAAGVAIDAACVHEEFACDVLREPLVNLRHWLFDSFPAIGRSHYYAAQSSISETDRLEACPT